MTKHNRRKSAFGSQEQPLEVGFTALFEQQQQASSLPIEPGPDATASAPETAVASAIKPTATVGQIASDLNANKGDSADRKFAVYLPADLSQPAIVSMFPVATADAVVIVDGVNLLGTLTRDDPTGDTSEHTFTAAAGMGANARVLAIQAAFAAVKPRRSPSAAINAVADALKAQAAGAVGEPLTLIVDQTGDGTMKLHASSAGSKAGVEADVAQTEPAAPVTAPGFW